MTDVDSFSLGVTQLLDELLAASPEGETRHTEPPAEELLAASPEGETRHTEPPAEELTPTQRKKSKDIPRLPIGPDTPFSGSEARGNPCAQDAIGDANVEDLLASPAFQRTADYCTEVDAYLSALGGLEEDTRRRRDDLFKELETDLESAKRDEASHAFAGDARIAQLRADAAELRQREAEATELLERGAEVEAEISPRLLATVTPRTLTAATGTTTSFYASGMLASKGLAFWCAEVESALNEPWHVDLTEEIVKQALTQQAQECCPERVPIVVTPSPSTRLEEPRPRRRSHAEDTIEGHLGMVQGALGVAQSRIQVSLGDLDRLLAQCDAMESQWSPRDSSRRESKPDFVKDCPEWTSRAVADLDAEK